MTAIPEDVAAVASCCHRTDEVAGLAGVVADLVQIAIWQRPVEPALRNFARSVLAADELEQVLEVEVEALATFDPLPASAHAADPDSARAFAADVRWLAGMFAELTGASRLGVRLVRLQKPMCPRFHTDFVGLRLLTTYCGVGTEWLEHEQVDRDFLGHRSMDVPDARSGLLRPGAVVQQLPEFAVGLLKGDAWPGNHGRGIVHRSPAARGEARILLSLDVIGQAGGHHGFDASGEGVRAPDDDDCCGGACGGGR